ncbi:MAG: formate dehydrogenase accessory sulfurtransferase FdhD [Luteimonas sp.]
MAVELPDAGAGDALSTGSVLRPVDRYRAQASQRLDDHIAEEVPVAFVYNDQPFAVMMATPADLEDFARGFALSEGIVEQVDEVSVDSVEHLLEGIEIRMRIPAPRHAALDSRRRSMSGRSGCGVCGSELLEAALRVPEPVGDGIAIGIATLRRSLRELRAGQRLNDRTGATHAAGWADVHGQVTVVREDVGRHNALDKLIGALARARVDPQSGFIVVTSRASYEMAMKTASAGVSLLTAISAPTALAIALAERANLTLIGFARDDGHAVYTHARRLLPDTTA